MENKNEQIANLQLDISENCSEIDKKIIKLYWKLTDNDFVNGPRWIREKFDITKHQLTRLISTYSTLSFYMYCKNCNSYESHQVKSQTKFINAVKAYRNRHSKMYECNYCEENEAKKLELDGKKKRAIYIKKFNSAIDNKNWKNLSPFDLGILRNCLKFDNFDKLEQHYLPKLGRSHYDKLLDGLQNIASENLLILKFDSYNNEIEDFDYLERLKKEFEYKLTKESLFEFNKESNELKFRLTKNTSKNNLEVPMYGGVFTPKTEIVLKENELYTFGGWNRSNDELFITIIPTSNIYNQLNQKRITKLPIHIQRIINEYLESIKY